MESCESQVSRWIYEHFRSSKHFEVLAIHPPDSKSYRKREIHFSYSHGGRKKRDVPDMICALGNWLLLIECKCALSESLGVGTTVENSDVAKLKRIVGLFGPSGVSKVLASQNPKLGSSLFRVLIPCLAVRDMDADVPDGFIVFEVGISSIRVHGGGQEAADWETTLVGKLAD